VARRDLGNEVLTIYEVSATGIVDR
jgi:hypothetical protein